MTRWHRRAPGPGSGVDGPASGLLELSGLEAGYGRSTVLHDVSFHVGEAELLAVIGANGAGKTTLLQTISGMTQKFGGTIRFRGEDITRASPRSIVRLGVGHVPEGRRLFPRHTVEGNLLLAAYLHRRQRSQVRESLERSYERFPVLGSRRSQLAGTMSGGEQQMLAIAMALMTRPRLLMLDEPSLGLAPAIVERVFEEVVTLRDGGTSVLLVEQRARMALDIADRAVVLKLGEVAMAGTPGEIGGEASIRAAYLGE